MRFQKFLLVLSLLVIIESTFGMNADMPVMKNQGGVVYLDKTDPIYIEIKNRVIND
jgi:hypothetical protein